MPTKIEIQQKILVEEKLLNENELAIKKTEQLILEIENSIQSAEKLIATSASSTGNWLNLKLNEKKTALQKHKEELVTFQKVRSQLLKSGKKWEFDLKNSKEKDSDSYFDLTKKVAELESKYPMLLFPVRLETRFNKAASGKNQIWIRVYPDTCQTTVDRNYLTQEEVNSVLRYLRNEPDIIAEKHGNNRTAFIKNWITTFDPVELLRILSAYGNQPDESATQILVDKLKIKIVENIPLPQADTLPDKFVFRLYDNSEKEIYNEVGKKLPVNLPLGFNRQKNSNVDWMHNFDMAIEIGMGIKIDIQPKDYKNGFAKIIVLGIKHSADKEEGKKLLENLFDNHYYSNKGLALLKQGAATNNADDENAGYSWRDNWETKPVQPDVANIVVTNNTERESQHFNDGVWLSQYLGINDNIFQKVENGAGKEQSDARAMNACLFPATLGYFFNEMLHPLISKTEIDSIENFFNNYVIGRGTIPAIRIGNQPYGILPVSVFEEIDINAVDSVRNKIQAKIKILYKQWDKKKNLIKHIDANNPVTTEEIIDILSLYPNSVSFYQRMVEDGTTHLNAANAAWNFLNIDEWWLEVMMFQSFGFLDSLYALGILNLTDRPEILYKIFNNKTTSLTGPVIESSKDMNGLKLPEVFSEKNGLINNYIGYLATNNVEAIRTDKGLKGDNKSLLYMFLKHAYLLKNVDTALQLKGITNLDSSALLKTQFMDNQVIKSHLNSKFGLLYEVNEKITKSSAQTLFEFIFQELQGNTKTDAINPIIGHRDSLLKISNLTTAQLQRAFVEHLDCCNYRIDAWINGLYSVQLRKQRKESNGWSKGIYIGAFGYLENIKPKKTQSEGYLLGPSLNHAAAGAILKNAQVAYAGNNSNPYDINMSSKRVKLALQVLEGMRNGQGLPELLGYRFERYLHDNSLDAYILALRKKYPFVQIVDPTQNNTPQESISASNVVHGLKLISDYEKNKASIFNFLDAVNADKKILEAATDNIQNILDAIKDIMLCEGVYQTLFSNYERSSSILDALNTGKHIPEIEVVNTPRSGALINHKVALQLTPVPVNTESISIYAILEPAVNKWLETILPNAENVVCKCTVNGEDIFLTQTHLNLQPIDLLYLINYDSQKSMTLLDDYIYAHIANDKSKNDFKILYTEKQHLKQYTLFELAAILKPMRKMILSSKYITTNTFQYKTGASISKTLITAFEKEKVDAVNNLLSSFDFKFFTNYEIKKVKKVKEIIKELSVLHNNLVLAGEKSNSIGLILDMLFIEGGKKVADQVIPTVEIKNFIKTLEQSISKKSEGLKTIQNKIGDELQRQSDSNTTQDTYSFEMLVKDLKNILGDDIVLLPRVELTENAPEIREAINGSNDLLLFCSKEAGIDFPVLEWLGGIARVNENMASVESIANYLEFANDRQPLKLTPIQLPFDQKDRWLAMQFSKDDDGFKAKDKMLYTFFGDTVINTENLICGLLIDEWTEVIPDKEQTAGLSFHFNKPNAEAPQTILLVTPPVIELNGRWKYEDVFKSILSTFELAKTRAIEPYHLSATGLAQLLPATILNATLYDTTVTTNLLQNLK